MDLLDQLEDQLKFGVPAAELDTPLGTIFDLSTRAY